MNFKTRRYMCMERESKRVKMFTNVGSMVAEDGYLGPEVTHRVQSGWKNW